MRKKAFTLVELLVVIAIIALLLAMLVPALNAARERARQLACLANIRQLGVATQTYASQTGYLPVYGAYEGGAPMQSPYAWAHNDPLVGPASAVVHSGPAANLCDNGVWVKDWYDPCCRYTPPAALIKNGDLDDATVIDQACPTSKSTMRVSYGYNYGMLGSSSRTDAYIYRDGDEWIKLTQIQIPAETGMYCDGITYHGDSDPPYDYPPRTGSYGIPWHAPGYWPDTVLLTVGSSTKIMGHRKGKVININFVGGHAKSMAPEMLHSVVVYQGDPWTPKERFGVYIWKRHKEFRGDNQPIKW